MKPGHRERVWASAAVVTLQGVVAGHAACGSIGGPIGVSRQDVFHVERSAALSELAESRFRVEPWGDRGPSLVGARRMVAAGDHRVSSRGHPSAPDGSVALP